jgi:quaternary ammonium compound-resistance protein SugE
VEMPWIYLFISGVFEIGWAIGLKATQGFTRPWPILYTLMTGGGSLFFLGLAMKDLQVGLAYPAWVGIGAAGAVAVGIFYFAEPATFQRIFFVVLILVGVAGLKISN